jgi:hypothetical protein
LAAERMKFVESSAFTDSDAAARKLAEIALVPDAGIFKLRNTFNVNYRRISYASDFSIHCRTNADMGGCYWRFSTTASKQIHPKTMLQFTNMRHGLHAVGNRQVL